MIASSWFLYSGVYFLFILFIFAPSSYCQEDMFYSECVNPFNCGILTNLSYPFWSDDRSQICGLRGFHLQCIRNEYPVITIENQAFLVVSLNQSQKEMTIVRTDVWDNPCPDDDDTTGFTNITLDAALFSFAPDFYTKFSNISIFYNCTDLQSPRYRQRFLCPVNGGERDAFYAYDGWLWGTLMEEISKCSIRVEIPAPKSSIGEQISIALRKGFNVSYKYGEEDCVRCRASGGICGTNFTTLGFTCFFPHHPVSSPNKPVIISNIMRFQFNI